MEMFILAAILIVLIAVLAGSKRRIGIIWSLFFGIFLTPLVQIIVTFSSTKKTQPPKVYHKAETIIGYILCIVSGMLLVIAVKDLVNNPLVAETGNRFDRFLSICIGFVGLGIYLITESNKKKKR